MLRLGTIEMTVDGPTGTPLAWDGGMAGGIRVRMRQAGHAA
jgi:hypothetical protein